MIRITIEQTEPWPHENNTARTKDTKVFEQTVESLDIPAVIAVINGLEKPADVRLLPYASGKTLRNQEGPRDQS